MRIRAANIPHRVICNKAVKVLQDGGRRLVTLPNIEGRGPLRLLKEKH